RAKHIAAELTKKEFCAKLFPVETNIIIFETTPSFSASEVAELFRQKDILVIAMSPTQVRLVLHLDIDATMTDYVADFISKM
ncbi:hypothetical protein, partial [Rhizobium leguminosarum]|uniref:hypothetical protein n=1 Tax=Rhizobium leguminosarum TaxID=384 RepID=UPI003F9D63A9